MDCHKMGSLKMVIFRPVGLLVCPVEYVFSDLVNQYCTVLFGRVLCDIIATQCIVVHFY